MEDRNDSQAASDLMENLIRSFPRRRLDVSSAEDAMTAVVQERLAASFDLPVPRDWRVLDHDDNAAMGYGPSTVLVADSNNTVYEVAVTVSMREVRRG